MISRRIRIVHVTKGGGGLDVYVKNILGHISSARFEQIVICNERHGDMYKWCQASGIRVIHAEIVREIHPLHDLRTALHLRKLLKALKPDVIHLHSSKAGALVRLICPFRRKQIIYTPNASAYLGATGIRRFIYLGIESLLAPMTGLLLASSDSEMRSLRTDLFLQPRSLKYFYNSLDVGEIEKLNLPEADSSQGTRIVCAARLIYQKNPHMLVRVARRVREEQPEATFHILGAGLDDFLGDDIRREIEKWDLNQTFFIHDWMCKADALRFVAESSIAVSTAVFESFGFFVAEAQALGRPIVATRVLGIEDVVDDTHSGFLVASDDDNAMAEKILVLIRNPELRRSMGLAGRSFVKKKFSIKHTAPQIEKEYANIAGEID
ncbi:N-acetylgalactosamine-N,N'-diacetylbacillosaminyl-diphospho-undecaprenol 4-alpha-N-acetylgalactosaminyltransferase [Lacunisphaera limnophila]|uniref:N-acetylgalactosamine-N, N'-diacetylbacillosaminyl-diphospho-undecaprenol 4-alpha-N-acetylgalactosaminyltransferase n=1 Tax=Lacunisphaera limnophila TaxID=1838286 RepID=A0A1D8AYB9_9BACT|nr:glycosyltransferase [Lacunisphaera limnophila]AOS45886.1 N-acetylgalactosamine-N,N'-diacetylbacillosaminyl-diphospho-undecaprenol 4-alpha-N-acetylgalactosaminyltransferase [Lacunisphaera limnophila]